MASAASAASVTNGPSTCARFTCSTKIGQKDSPGATTTTCGSVSHCDTMPQARSPDSGTRKARDVSGDAHKGEQRLPRQTDLLSAVECLSEPVPTTLVSGRTRVVRIEQDIRVEDDHRLSGPSIRSSSLTNVVERDPRVQSPEIV